MEPREKTWHGPLKIFRSHDTVSVQDNVQHLRRPHLFLPGKQIKAGQGLERSSS